MELGEQEQRPQTTVHCSNVNGGSSSWWCSNTPATARRSPTAARPRRGGCRPSHTVRVRQLDEHDHVRSLVRQHRVHGVPDPLPMAVDDPPRLGPARSPGRTSGSGGRPAPGPTANRRRRHIAAAATVFAEPAQNGASRPSAGAGAARPGSGTRGGVHSVASLPKIDELTGVTIGPEQTMATSAPGTCASTRRGSGGRPRCSGRARACSTRRGCHRSCSAAAGRRERGRSSG